MLAVAHRAGNSAAGLRAALASGVDLVEADVHLYRGALEVRHPRTIGPHLLWDPEGGFRRRRDLAVPDLGAILAIAGDDPRLLLDLKGRSFGVAARVAETLRVHRPGVPVAVCTKEWHMLDAFARYPNVRRLLSAANTRQLTALRTRLRSERADGVSIRLRLLTERIVTELRAATDLVLAWPVDTRESLTRAERIGVTGVISKSLPLLGR